MLLAESTEILVNIQSLAFYAAIFFTILGACMGLVGVWIKDIWQYELAFRLVLTDAILAVTSIIVAAIARWLG